MTKPIDHNDRMQRAKAALEGLSVGDAFGERFFGPPGFAQSLIALRKPPPPEWGWTDDTAMALSVVEVLERHGRIHQDDLAECFARRHSDDPLRGYGAGARQVLRSIEEGTPWRRAAAGPFGDLGSFGNGGAMRVAPLGAYFADDAARVVEEATLSAEVTHLHPEGQAGAVAIALAAAYAWRRREAPATLEHPSLLAFVEAATPAGEVRRGIRQAMAMPPGTTVEHAAAVLGNGERVSAQDTVPLCLWAADRWLEDYEEALWQTVSALGDRDTTCAIVGGVVALGAGRGSIPERWLASREGLPRAFLP